MHAIARHTLVNLSGFALSSLIGFAIVGLVVAQYGLAAFGLIMLVRIFAPGQIFSIFSFGLPEVVSRETARGLAAAAVGDAVRTFVTALLVAAATGLVLCLPLILAPAWVARTVLGLDAADAEVLRPVILAQGIVLPLLFASSIAGAASKGQEAFARLRTADLMTDLAYGLTALLLIQLDAGVASIALAFLGWLVPRALFILIMALRGFGKLDRRDLRPGLRLLWQHRDYMKALSLRQAGSMATSQLPRLLLSHILGPASVGLYEALLRMPKFLKTVIGLTNGVVMPVVVRLGTKGSHDELASLVVQGPRLLLSAASVLALPFICLGEPFLRLWLGQEVAAYWPWFAALCGLPLVTATAGFWSAMGKAELKIVRLQNRVGLLQGAVFFAVALSLVGVLETAAFWLGMFASVLVSVPAMLWINARRFALPPGRLALPVLTVLAVSLPAAALGIALAHWVTFDTWPLLLSGLAAVAVVQSLVLALLIVRPEERRALLRLKLRRS